jgi:hypothetical protein
MVAPHRHAEPRKHAHGPGCGHDAILHEDHVNYLHDGHRHREHPAEESIRQLTIVPERRSVRCPGSGPFSANRSTNVVYHCLIRSRQDRTTVMRDSGAPRLILCPHRLLTPIRRAFRHNVANARSGSLLTRCGRQTPAESARHGQPLLVPTAPPEMLPATSVQRRLGLPAGPRRGPRRPCRPGSELA